MSDVARCRRGARRRVSPGVAAGGHGAEFAGGLLLILLMWVGVRLFVSAREEKQVREHAREAQTGHQHAIASGRRTLREKLASVEAWSDVAHNFRGDWQMLWLLEHMLIFHGAPA